MIRAYLDSNVFLHATGAPHRYRGACRSVRPPSAASSLQRGMEVVVSADADADFDMVLGLRRVDPLDRTAVATLTS